MDRDEVDGRTWCPDLTTRSERYLPDAVSGAPRELSYTDWRRSTATGVAISTECRQRADVPLFQTRVRVVIQDSRTLPVFVGDHCRLPIAGPDDLPSCWSRPPGGQQDGSRPRWTSKPRHSAFTGLRLAADPAPLPALEPGAGHSDRSRLSISSPIAEHRMVAARTLSRSPHHNSSVATPSGTAQRPAVIWKSHWSPQLTLMWPPNLYPERCSTPPRRRALPELVHRATWSAWWVGSGTLPATAATAPRSPRTTMSGRTRNTIPFFVSP